MEENSTKAGGILQQHELSIDFRLLWFDGVSLNRSINQTYIATISQAKPHSVRQLNQCSTAKSKKQFHNINRPSGMQVSMGEREVKEMCLQIFIEGSNWNGWMNRQQEVVPKGSGPREKSSCTCLGLDLRDWHTIIVLWFQWTGWKWCSEHGVKINRLFLKQGFVGQQIDRKQYSKPYWQPMKGTKQWNTASKWRRLCHQVGQSFLNMLKPCEVNVGDTMQKWVAIIKMTGNKSSCKQFLHYPDQGDGEYAADRT